MIYYFSGTGNSHYAAEKTARATGDRCVNIADIYKGKVKSVVGKSDVTGFVFPVYYGGLPEMVLRFVSNPEIKNRMGSYVFAVITCGANTYGAGDRLAKALGRPLDLCVSVKMPDNYVVAYDPSTPEEAVETLRKADAKLGGIADRIMRRESYARKAGAKDKFTSGAMYLLYNPFRVTAFFKADDNCTGCGLCEKLCPEGIIKLKDGKPEWTKRRCQHCTACINRCPARAIQFGRLTAKRGRYNIMNLK